MMKSDTAVSFWNAGASARFRMEQHWLPNVLMEILAGSHSVDITNTGSNNLAVEHAPQVRRIKTFSAATGFVYQYCFVEMQKSRRGFSVGAEYIYRVSRDRQTTFPLRIFVRRAAIEQWGKRAGRQLTGTEEYAVAKMRLFQAFDEIEDLARTQPDLVVDETNLEALMTRLDL